MRLNSNEVEKRSNELQTFRGFLPFQFDGYVNLVKRKEFLVEKGLWDEVHEQELTVMRGIRETRPNEDVYLDKLLKRWIKENPQFKDLVIID